MPSASDSYSFDLDAQRRRQQPGKRAVVGQIRFVLDAGAAIGQQHAAALDVFHQLVGDRVGQHVQMRSEHQLVAAQVVARPDDVDVDARAEQRVVVALDRLRRGSRPG